MKFLCSSSNLCFVLLALCSHVNALRKIICVSLLGLGYVLVCGAVVSRFILINGNYEMRLC